MQNKLQELTDKLYNEGLSKGKQEADKLVSQAKKEASEIIAKAKEEAEKIMSEAAKEAVELKNKAENDIRMAGTQAISAIKQSVEKAIVAKAIGSPVSEATNDTEFIQEVILTIAKAFNPENAEPVALNLILPEAKKGQMDEFITNKFHQACAAELNITYSKSIDKGFKVGPKEGRYLINFTDEEFFELIAQYLRPKTRTLLFG